MQGLDLKIEGREALVCGSSAGLGRACARALARAGARVTLNGRSEERLKAAAEDLAKDTGATIRYAVGDVTTPAGRREVLGVCSDPDVLINNSQGPPPKEFASLSINDWEEAARVSMFAPIMMIQAVIGGMITRRWGRIINITSSAVKAPLPMLHLSNGARSGLTGFVAGVAREVADKGVTINNLLPGRFETDRLKSYINVLAARERLSPEEQALRMSAANPMKRFGHPDEFGAFAVFLASEHAAYFTGQNVLIDGGEYPGLL